MKELILQTIPIAEKPALAEDKEPRSLTEEEKSAIMAWKISNTPLLIEKFPPETHKEIAQILIEKSSDLRILTRNIDKFTGLDHNDHKKIAKFIIDKEKGGEFSSIGHTISKFVGLDHKEIAKSLIESGHGLSLAMNLDKFKSPDQPGFLKWLFENEYYAIPVKAFKQGILTEWNSDLSKTIINSTDYAPHAKSFIEGLRQLGLWRDSLFDTPESFFALVDLSKNAKKNLELFQEHAWLARAFTDNPRDSFRLVHSFPELDKHSQENIEILYEIKSKSPVDPVQDPVGFRRYMQESLRNYKNNNEMCDLISARLGVPMDTFLNYDQTENFVLGAEEERSFNDMVRTPLTRIQSTFDVYSKTFKEALGQYRQTLSTHQVTLEDNEALQTEIAKMEVALEKARTENNEKKVQGIEKAIVGAQNRLANPKKAPLLNKIFGDFDSVMRLQRDLILANSAIEKAHNVEQGALQGTLSTLERRMKTQEIKAERERLEKVFKDKLAIMDRRFRDFQESLPTLIAPALSPEQVKAMLEEMKVGAGEQLDHYSTDVVTLGNILNEDNNKDKLEGRSMSIELWTRDPDVDLYLGNYTSCCVSIDNDFHDGESPIADYLTDIGMQVITITDQKRQRPVVAAWCYIGTDKDKNVALVIDNIEADTKYSVPFHEQLEEKLRVYIEEYAKVSGIKIISQGPHNNDLIVSTLEERYAKLGGYNRKNGYYLEGEPD